MVRTFHIGAALLAACLGSGAARASEAAPSGCTQALSVPAADLEYAALQAFRDHHYAAAYGRFARLADAGNAPAAESALFMLINGPALFGSEWTATEKQQRCWNVLLVARARQRLPQISITGD